MSDSNRFAPKGKTWVCSACGKTAHDRFGKVNAMRGWDESCAINAVLVKYEDILDRWPNGRVKKVR